MKEDKLSKAQKTILKIGVILCTIVFVYGVLVVVDEYQRYKRSKNTTESIDIGEYVEDIPAFDVEGLSDDEIDEMLELYRQQREEQGW